MLYEFKKGSLAMDTTRNIRYMELMQFLAQKHTARDQDEQVLSILSFCKL